jgi:hypothetical protein
MVAGLRVLAGDGRAPIAADLGVVATVGSALKAPTAAKSCAKEVLSL